MDQFLQTLIAGISLGSLYALIALGYTLVYGVLKFINFAHSDIFVLGAWSSFSIATVLLSLSGGQPSWWMPIVAVIGAVLVCGVVGLVVERFAYRPLRTAPRLNVLITAIGVSLLLQNVGQLRGFAIASNEQGNPVATVPFDKNPKSMPEIIPERVLNRSTIAAGTANPGTRRGVIQLTPENGATLTLTADRVYRVRLAVGEAGTPAFRAGEFTISSPAGTYQPGADVNIRPPRDMKDYQNARFEIVRDPSLPILLSDVLIITCAVVLMVALQYLVFKTKFGTAMRALSFSTTTAPLMGINVNRVIAITFVVGTSLAAVAAFLYLLKYPNNLKQSADQVWVLLGLKAFVAAVVGGIGNVRGAVLGGFLIALIEQLGVLYGDKLLLALGARPGLGTSLGDVYVFSVLILVLLLRPNGILGQAVREKV